MNKLTAQAKRELVGLLSKLKPVVLIGHAGLTANVILEIENALDYHELIKIRVNATSSEARATIIEQICSKTGAELVQTIGFIVAIYRKNEETEIKKRKK